MMPRSSSGEFQAVLQPLRGGEDAAQRRADVLAEDVGDAQMLFAVVQCQANGLNQCGHANPRQCLPVPARQSGVSRSDKRHRPGWERR